MHTLSKNQASDLENIDGRLTQSLGWSVLLCHIYTREKGKGICLRSDWSQQGLCRERGCFIWKHPETGHRKVAPAPVNPALLYGWDGICQVLISLLLESGQQWEPPPWASAVSSRRAGSATTLLRWAWCLTARSSSLTHYREEKAMTSPLLRGTLSKWLESHQLWPDDTNHFGEPSGMSCDSA